MNRKILPIILFPLILSIASCGREGKSSDSVTEASTDTQKTGEGKSSDTIPEETIDNQEDVDYLKSLLAKQDLSPFNEKYFSSMYTQNFTVYTNSMDDDGKFIEVINYNGAGGVAYYYDVDEEVYSQVIENENINIFDIMCQGYGCYELTQNATVNSYLNDEFEDKIDQERSTFFQDVGAQFTDTTLQIANTYLFVDFYDDEDREYRLFNGIIDKEILFGSYTTKTLSNLFSRINVYDGPGFCETIDSLYYQICYSLLESSDKEISEFIINNNVEYDESKNYLELSFELKEDKYIEYLSEHDVIPGIIKGTLHIDKETKALDSFEYRIIHFEEDTDLSTNYIHTASMEFKAEGMSRHGEPESGPYMDEDATVFTDPTDFIEQVTEQVIPRNA